MKTIMRLVVITVVMAMATTTAAARKLSPEADKLLKYITAIEGQYMLSGTMANVNWNTNEAQWVYKHTGRWPAINCFDYIHLFASSPNSWINYGNTKVAEDWHKQGGIVAAMWHWMVKANDGTNYTYQPGTNKDQTTFDVRKIKDPSSTEYRQMISDIDKVAGYLKLLKDKNIPVLWRPLHEAAGRWFWWGTDAEACRLLWKTMYERFEAAGLDNLIWVWTDSQMWGSSFAECAQWYPGDEYVDIVGFDVYNNSNVTDIYRNYYSRIGYQWPGKPRALTECGNVAKISSQWNGACEWVWFIPWYDYDRTKDTSSTNFNSTSHGHAPITWWKDAWAQDFVLSRDQVNIDQTLADGITSPTLPTASDAIYSINGTRLNSASGHGMYIIGGRKVIK